MKQKKDTPAAASPAEPAYILAPVLTFFVRESGTVQRDARYEKINGPAASAALFGPMAEGQPCEVFLVAYLNSKREVIALAEISRGTLDSSLVHAREVFAPAIALRACCVLLAHNHPSGDPEPSDADRAVTRRLVDAGRLLGIQVLDHLVISSLDRSRYVSFQERGLLAV